MKDSGTEENEGLKTYGIRKPTDLGYTGTKKGVNMKDSGTKKDVDAEDLLLRLADPDVLPDAEPIPAGRSVEDGEVQGK
jgi:hypothetical protein